MLRRGTAAVLVLVVAAAMAAVAPAAVTKSELKLTVSPSKQSAKRAGGVSLSLTSLTEYDAYAPSPPHPSAHARRTVLHFDDDFVFSTAGYPQCDRNKLTNTTTAQAIAACPQAVIGSGRANVNGVIGPGSAVVTLFNGVPQGGRPTVLLHARTDPPPQITSITVGVLEPSERGGDFGQQLDLALDPQVNGYEVITSLQVNVSKRVTKKGKKGKPARYYVAARCRDKNRVWNFMGDTTFVNNPPASGSFMIAAPSQQKCKPRGGKKPKK